MIGQKITKCLSQPVNKFLSVLKRPRVKKNRIFVSFAAISIVIAIFFFIENNTADSDFNFFTIDCDIYNRNGKLVFRVYSQLCSFADDGKVLASNHHENTLSMTNSAGDTLWTAHENIHHDLKFSNDQKSLLLISGEVIEFKGRLVRSDCFSKRDLENKIIGEWCLSANIPQLEKLGFTISMWPNTWQPGYPTDEISHANTIYEIPANLLSEKYPPFREGNFLVDLHKPIYALLILDSKMKTILWSKSLEKWPYGIQRLNFSAHDSQVTPEGKILSYFNWYKVDEPPVQNWNNITRYSRSFLAFNWHSNLVEFDPYLDSINWIYESAPPEKFRSGARGSVTSLKNKNYLFSDITESSVIYEVNRRREIIWKFEVPKYGGATSAPKVQKVKPMYNPAFLRARRIID